MAALKMEDACAQAGCRFAHGGLGGGNADGQGGWHATGGYPALGCTDTMGVPQASPHFPRCPSPSPGKVAPGWGGAGVTPRRVFPDPSK